MTTSLDKGKISEYDEKIPFYFYCIGGRTGNQ